MQKELGGGRGGWVSSVSWRIFKLTGICIQETNIHQHRFEFYAYLNNKPRNTHKPRSARRHNCRYMSAGQKTRRNRFASLGQRCEVTVHVLWLVLAFKPFGRSVCVCLCVCVFMWKFIIESPSSYHAHTHWHIVNSHLECESHICGTLCVCIHT